MTMGHAESRRIAEVLSLTPGTTDLCVCGWVRTRRDARGFSFLEVNDGSCIASLQVVADSALANYDSEILHLTAGSSIVVNGELAPSPGKGQRVELRATCVDVVGTAAADYPLQKKRHSLEFLREIAHLRPRTNTIGAVARVRSSLSHAIHRFFEEKEFYYIHTPIITASDCEGAGEMFRVTTMDAAAPARNEQGEVDFSRDFFGRRTSLTVSGQLEAEAYASALGRVYTFGPTFRAENSNTPRHLAEFWMVEPEAAFFNLYNNMDLAEEFVRYLAARVLEKNREDLEFFNLRIDNTVIEVLENMTGSAFERVTYTEAISLLEKNNNAFEYKVAWGRDLHTEHERHLSESVFAKPVVVYDYPVETKPFYMKRNDDGRTVRAMDLLVPRIGELIGGSEREDRYDELAAGIEDAGLCRDDYRWYLDLRKYGSVPHSGFGLGFERLLLLVTGMQNIRDVIPFPRYPGNAEF